MSYNSLSFEDLLPIAEAIHQEKPLFPPRRGIGAFTLHSLLPVPPKDRARENFHTPKRTRDYETAVKNEAKRAMWEAGYRTPFLFPLKIDLQIRQVVPKSWSQVRRYLAAYEMLFITQRDLDNMEKAVMDALNGAVFVDDRQVVNVTKAHSVMGIPGFTATIYPAGLTKDETDRVEKIVRQLRKG